MAPQVELIGSATIIRRPLSIVSLSCYFLFSFIAFFLSLRLLSFFFFFFFNDAATTEIYTLPLHDALPISGCLGDGVLSAFPNSRAQRGGNMARTLSGISLLLILVALTKGAPVARQAPAAQQFPPGYIDPRPILEAARKAIGTDALHCVTISGTAYDGAVGQQKEAGKNIDWPRIDSLANYTRTMNWDNWTMKEEFDRKPGLAPAMWN